MVLTARHLSPQQHRTPAHARCHEVLAPSSWGDSTGAACWDLPWGNHRWLLGCLVTVVWDSRVWGVARVHMKLEQPHLPQMRGEPSVPGKGTWECMCVYVRQREESSRFRGLTYKTAFINFYLCINILYLVLWFTCCIIDIDLECSLIGS